MPRVPTITKEMVLEEAMNILRKEGIEKLNVRNIAKGLNCSTQPVMYVYKNMDELKEELYAKLDNYHSEFIGDISTAENPLIEIGLKYIEFAAKEKNFFKFLFQSNKFQNIPFSELINGAESELSFIIDIMQQEVEVTREEAISIFENIFICVHGISSFIANNSMDFDREYCIRKLEDSFVGSLMKIKGEERND